MYINGVRETSKTTIANSLSATTIDATAPFHIGIRDSTNAPFDGIIVTAAATEIPAELLEQLAVGAQLVIPLEKNAEQRLISVRRTEDGFEETDLGGVVFVPMLSGLA